ncbi:phage holin family protein [Candidatus Woesearchaeota archaeon]|nr:phage holin family protein [Candidatus Woesearchaeota archaeon]
MVQKPAPSSLAAPRFKQVILAVAIAVVLAFMINYTLSVVYEEPKWELYCPMDTRTYDDEVSCSAVGGKWSVSGELEDDHVSKRPIAKPVLPRDCPSVCVFDLPSDVCQAANLASCMLTDLAYESDCQQKGGTFHPSASCPTAKQVGYCDVQYTCRINYEAASDIYQRNIFVVQMICGIIVLILGIALAIPSVSGGMMSGAVITMFIALTGYWGDLNQWLRVGILWLILAILVWLGYKKLRR